MAYTVTEESFDSLTSYWTDKSHRLRWGSVFVLPIWLKVWWQVFGSGAELYLCSVKKGDKIIGIAPLAIRDKEASLVGSTDVCDYVDFVVVPGMETDFFVALLDNLRHKGISELHLEPLRADSAVINGLKTLAQKQGYNVLCRRVDVTLELGLPPTWEEYLGMLQAKQRHELGRKMRRLGEEGEVNYRTIEDSRATGVIDTFLKLFTESRQDKAAFMTPKREEFFRFMVEVMAEARLLRFGILELRAQPVAMVMCFDNGDVIYLYNSGYEPQYSSLSVGIISKALCIKDSIKRGRKRFDFLKGAERYKYQLGGMEIPLYSCQITIG